MARRSIKASTEGIQILRKAFRKKQGGQSFVAGAIGCTRQTIWSLLHGNPIDCDFFMAACSELGLNWEEIAEPESAEPEAIAPSTIDRLVQEVRDRIQPLIQQACGTMRVLDMSYPIGLNDIYTDVNILEKITSTRTLKWAEMMREAGREQFDRFCLGDVRGQRIPGLKAVKDHPKLMVLGKPGAGKTTFLKRLAMQCIGGKVMSDRVPLFVTLKDFAEADGQPSLLDYLDRWAGLLLEAIVQAGRALILLDGLDEVREGDSDRVLRQIKAFSQQYSQNCFVITCRIAAREYTYEQFTEVEVADFDDTQIAEFSNNWFRSRNDAVKAERFLARLKEDQPIRELAASPLLLTLLCLVFEDSGDFPTNRTDIYRDGVDLLMRKWDEKQNIKRDQLYKRLSPKRKKDLLGYVALTTFEVGNYFFKQREAERYIEQYFKNQLDISIASEALELDAAVVLESIEAQHGLLIERARGIYSFSHLTFHEYFTAQEFANNSDPQKLEQALQSLVKYITEKRYREVFLLIVEMLPNANYLLHLMKSQTDALLAEDTRLQQFLTWVKEKLTAVNTQHKPAAVLAYYLGLDLDLNLFRSRALGLALDFNLYHALALDLTLDLDRVLFRSLALDLALPRALALARVLVLDCVFALDFALEHALDLVIERELHQELQKLRDQLPDFSYNNRENFKHWWQANGQVWTEQLRAVMIKHRNIGHDWRFTDKQKELLQQHYDANKLIVDCLNSDCRVSQEVRQEIEETLLLPIAEIEAWKRDRIS